MNKKMISMIVILAIGASMLVGCQRESQAELIEETPKEAKVTTEDEATMIMVMDQIGRTVEVPTEVTRIVSSYNITSSLLIALEAQDKVVGLEMKADTREIYKRSAPEFLELPGIGSGKSINVEEVLVLDPDVVFIPYRLQEFIPQFEELGIPVVAVEPESMEDFLVCIDLVGAVIGESERAQQLIDYYNEKIDEVTTLTADITERPTVYIAGSGSPLTTVTQNMYQHDLIEMAGGENVSAALTDGHWANISAEELIVWDPDYILCVQYAAYDLEEITNDPKFESLSAVQNGHVYTFPSVIEPWDYPTPSSILGVLWLLNQLHPELYTVEQYSKEAQVFYQTFFDLEVSAEDMGL